VLIGHENPLLLPKVWFALLTGSTVELSTGVDVTAVVAEIPLFRPIVGRREPVTV